MRVYMSVDIEGCTGIVSFSQCGRPDSMHFDWAFARNMLLHDVNAAIRGARAAGATSICIKDGHAHCRNLLIDGLEPGVELISGASAGPDGMMAGLDETFDAAILIGYHALAGTTRGMMDHALVGGLHRCWLNGGEVGEFAVSAAVAGAYGVPLVCVTSDAAGCAEATAALPGVSTFATKRGFGRYAGDMLSTAQTQLGIEAAVRGGLERRAHVERYSVEAPVTLRISFRTSNEADLASQLPDTRRVDGYTVEFSRQDIVSAHRHAYLVFALSIHARSAIA